MNDGLMQDFIQLISANTGLHIRQQDQQDLCKKLYARMKSLKLSAPEQYYQLLKTSNTHKSLETSTHLTDSPWTQAECDREWQELALLLTIGETYFFRDCGQISLLKNRLLPELIKLKITKKKRSLRIWSAGCSTGEEVYSLAILINELIPDLSQWDILILGTDINCESIEKAKQGIYNSWSFRIVDPKLKQQYFNQHHTTWKINNQIRSMVDFCTGNLLIDPFPNSTSDIHNIDIILCRNVFIYFDSRTISIILNKFYNTLNCGGYLIAGHTELNGQNLGQLQAKVFPESVVYQRSQENLCEIPSNLSTANSPLKQQNHTNSKGVTATQSIASSQRSITAILPTTTKANFTSNKTVTSNVQTIHSVSKAPLIKETLPEITSSTLLSQAKAHFNDGVYESAIKEAEQVIKQYPKYFDAYYLIAQAFANLGNSKQAIEYSQQALKIDSSSVAPYYLLAHIAEEQGDSEQAKQLFKKIIYLAPSSIAAYLELGAIYETEGDIARSGKMRNTALALLKELPHNTSVEHQGEITASELIIHVKKLLKK